MTIVRIPGYSSNEGTCDFVVLPKDVLLEKIDKKLEELSDSDIYKMAFEKAERYHHSGTAYVYISAIDGELYTNWLQQNTEQHPWADYDEIVLCCVNTPIVGPYAEDLLDINGKEWNDFNDWQSEHGGDVLDYFISLYGKEKGQEEYDYRYDNWVDWLSLEFFIDWVNVEDQINTLYFTIVEK